jgi:hypothetical protein
MNPNRQTMVIGVFKDRAQAQQAVRELRAAGFGEDQIGFIARRVEGENVVVDTSDPTQSHWEEGAAVGAASGAVAGGLWALGIAAGMLPAVGPIIAGGLLASVLASAAGTAVAGGIIGALLGLGIPEEEARYYESEFKSGRTLVTVRPDGRADEAWAILRRCGCYEPATASSLP